MRENKVKFPAKILLFGEYSILAGSMGLSIPFFRFGGRLLIPDKPLFREKISLAGHLKKFHEYLYNIKSADQGIDKLDLKAFKADLDKGQYFSSDIPVNHGVGSSGALVAAVYDKYGTRAGSEKDQVDLGSLRAALARMESFFHGTSSGLDPLTSMVQEPLVVSNGNKIMTTSLKLDENNVCFFLLDSGVQGKTGPLVREFRQKMKEAKYASVIENEYVPLNDKLVRTVVEGNSGELIRLFEKLSRLQLELFPAMIPEQVVEIWKEGLSRKKYFLKLCGSGGGGFMLGIAQSLEETRAILSPLGYPLIATGF